MPSYKEFIDKKSIMQVLGSLLKNPLLLKRTDKYNLDVEDFGEEFYKILYGAINNLSAQGLKKIELLDLENYLSSRPTIYNIYNKNKGSEYVKEILELVDESNFNYYYNRIKKMTLLRVYERYGIDVRWLYNPSNFDLKIQQQQEDWFDKTDIGLMAQQIDDRINNIKSKYLSSVTNEGFQAGDNIFALINDLKKSPAVGIPMYGKYINTVTRGARLKKFYLRSAASGKGKTRSMIADACTFSCGQYYDIYEKKWTSEYSSSEPTLYISTEQELDEIQTMMLAFLSGVPEDSILNGFYLDDEEERVLKAAEILTNSPLWIETLPDFSLEDIENTIRKHNIDNNVHYVCHDYIHTSLKILEEIGSRSGVRLREDNVLYMLGVRLKDLCNELNIFILSATQLNGNWEEVRDANQNLLRGRCKICA